MSRGFSVENKFANDVIHFCDNKKLDYQIWNAQKFLTTKCDAELTFGKDADFESAFAFYRRIVKND